MLSPVFPSYSGSDNTGSMSLSKASHFFSDVCDKDSTGKTTETTAEQTVVRITREVVRGLVGLDAAGGGERQFDGVYQTVLVVFTQYRTQLDRLVSMMSVTDTETTVRSFGAVLDRLADGQQINCGRVVTALAFAGCVVQHCIEKEIISSDDVNQLAEVLGRKIASWFVNGQHNLVGIHLLSQLRFNSCFPHHRGLAGCPSVLAARAKTFARSFSFPLSLLVMILVLFIFVGLGRFRYMAVLVQRGGQYRYVTTSVHMRSISVHVFFVV